MRFYCGGLPSVCAWHCGSVVGICPRFAHGIAVLLRWFASVHACLFSFVRKKETACDVLRFYSAGSRSPFVRSRYVCMVICLWQVHFGFVRFFMAISTGYRDAGNGDTGYGDGGAAFVRFCASTLALKCFPRGVRWGCAPPDCAKESSTLWTLFRGWPSGRVRFTRRGCVGANTHPCKKRKCPNQRTHARKTRGHGKTRPALIYGRTGRAV